MWHAFPGQLWPRLLVTIAVGSWEAIFSSVKWRSGRSQEKGQMSNLINAIRKVPIWRSLSSRIRWCLLFCYATQETCSNMHLNYMDYAKVSRIQINEMHKSAISYISSRNFQKWLILMGSVMLKQWNNGTKWNKMERLFHFSRKLKIVWRIFKNTFLGKFV